MFNPSSLGNCGWIPQGQPDCAPPSQFNNHPNFNSEINQQIQAARNEAQQQINIQVNENIRHAEQQQRENAERERVERENQARIAQEEAARQAHEAELRRLEHERFCAEHPLEAAQGWVNDAVNHINAMEHNKNHAEHLVRESEQRVQQITNEYNHLKAKVDGVRHRGRGLGGRKRSFVLDAIGNAMCIADWDRQLNGRMGDIQAAQEELNQRRAHLDHCHHQLHEAHQNKSRADANLGHVQNTIRQQQEAHAAYLAQQETQRKADEAAAAQKKADEAAEAHRKAEAAKLKEQQEVQRKTTESSRVVKEVIAVRSVEKADSLVTQSGLPKFPELSLHQLGKDIAQSAGELTGVGASVIETVIALKNAVEDPLGAGKALYHLATIDNKIDKLDNALSAKLDSIKLEEDKDTLVGAFNAGFEKAKLKTEVASTVLGAAGATKATGVLATKTLGTPLYWAKNASANFKTVQLADTGIVWGKAIDKQGIPWEDLLEPQFPKGSRLPPKFQTFDFFDLDTKKAVSAKTLETLTPARLKDPTQIYDSLKKNIDDVIDFKDYSLKKRSLDSSMIESREVRVAIQSATTDKQWVQIHRAMDYARDNNITLTIVKVE